MGASTTISLRILTATTNNGHGYAVHNTLKIFRPYGLCHYG